MTSPDGYNITAFHDLLELSNLHPILDNGYFIDSMYEVNHRNHGTTTTIKRIQQIH